MNEYFDLNDAYPMRNATVTRNQAATPSAVPRISMSIVIPCYNEASGLIQVLPPLIECCCRHGWHILVIDDGSSDDSDKVLNLFAKHIRVIRNNETRGYGAAIKRGIMACETEWVATFDGDGQHKVEDLEKLARKVGFSDAVIGRRTSRSHCSLLRRPGKWILGKIANLLVGKKIQDINCGLRIFRRDAVLQTLRLSSDSFSFTTSTLIALVKMGFDITHESVTTDRRIGCSSVRQVRDGFNSVLFILRLIMLFDPLRVMLPIAGCLFIFGVIYQITSFAIYGFDLNKLTILLWISGIVIFLVALVADQVSTLRREIAAFSTCETATDNRHANASFNRPVSEKISVDGSLGGTSGAYPFSK